MSIATGIQSLRELVDRFQDGGTALAADVASKMREVEKEARKEACEQLALLCEAGAETITTLLGNEQLAEHAELIQRHLDEVVTFAEQWAAAAENGDATDGIQAPEVLSVGSDAEDQQFAETVGMFVGNALGALTDLEEELLSVESAGDRFEETVSGIRRTVHTLKAEFGVLNMLTPQTLCHQAETTIDAIVESGQPFPVDTLLAFGDQIKQFVERLTHDVKAEFVSEARSHLADAEVAMVELSREPDNVENLNLTFRAFHTIKGVAGFLNLTAVVELAHVAETLLDGGRSGRFVFDAEDIDLVLAAGDMITQMIAALEGQDAPTVGAWQQLKDQLAERADRRVDAESAPPEASQQDGPKPGEEPAEEPAEEAAEKLAVAKSQATAATPAGATPSEQTPAGASPAGDGPAGGSSAGDGPAVVTPQPPAKKKVEVKAARVERTIKVSTTRLDMLVDMVGELVIAQSMVLQDPAIQRLDSQGLSRNIGQVGKITRDLQEAAMSLRMVTVKSTFQKMARLVRDVASKSKKRVNLTIAGEDTELDRNVVEQISDPLVHMIRNAIDHGIEAPADRGTVGKDEEGQLSLSAYHQGGSIVI
ncbi:MAG: chemotaxis protein CheA [Planctomycetota bacterium]